MNKSGWIGFDLDGTLAFYDEWRGADHIGAPIPPMVERVQRYLREGYQVKIFTARVSGQGRATHSVEEIRKIIEDWTEKHIGTRLEVTNVKDYGMIRLYDDRAVRIRNNAGEPCCNDHVFRYK